MLARGETIFPERASATRSRLTLDHHRLNVVVLQRHHLVGLVGDDPRRHRHVPFAFAVLALQSQLDHRERIVNGAVTVGDLAEAHPRSVTSTMRSPPSGASMWQAKRMSQRAARPPDVAHAAFPCSNARGCAFEHHRHQPVAVGDRSTSGGRRRPRRTAAPRFRSTAAAVNRAGVYRSPPGGRQPAPPKEPVLQ